MDASTLEVDGFDWLLDVSVSVTFLLHAAAL